MGDYLIITGVVIIILLVIMIVGQKYQERKEEKLEHANKLAFLKACGGEWSRIIPIAIDEEPIRKDGYCECEDIITGWCYIAESLNRLGYKGEQNQGYYEEHYTLNDDGLDFEIERKIYWPY